MCKRSASIFISIFFCVSFCFAQNDTISKKIQTAFAGTWQTTLKFNKGAVTNTVVIKFEKGKDYATFIDIGTGEAPGITLQARVKDSILVIPAAREKNDYVELEIIKEKLQVRTRPVIWDSNGNPLDNSDTGFGIQNFKRVRK